MDKENKENKEKIVALINEAMGVHADYFDIEAGYTLDEGRNYFSTLVSFKPKKIDLSHVDNEVVGQEQHLQFDIEDGEVVLITGEDGNVEMNITFGNIYSQLYWGEIIKVIE